MSLERRARALIALMGLAFLLLGGRAILSMSPTTDEPGHYRYGHRILRGVAARWDDSKMPISALNALPCWTLERTGSHLRDIDEFAGPCDWTLARVPTLFGGLALGLAIAAWSKALYGWPGALLSFALFAFDPNLIAHSSLVTTDIFGALFLLLALRAFAAWIDRPGVKQAAGLGALTGMASISKYTAAYLPLIFGLALLLSWRRLASAVEERRARIAGLFGATLLTLVIINIGFLGDGAFGSLRDQRFESPQFRELRKLPGIASVPLPVPRPFIEGLDRVLHRERNGGGSGNLYFLGELRPPGSEGFKTYFAVVGFFKTPLPALALLALATALLLRRRERPWSTDERTLLASLLIFVPYFSLIFRAQIGLRHFLVVYPAAFVLAGIAGPWLARARWRTACAALASLLSAASVTAHGPDPLSYFNEAIAPTRTWRIAADSNLDWGQSKAKVEEWIAAHPDVLVAPAKPFPGRVLVGANVLTGVVMRKRTDWLRDAGLEPLDQIAHTHFLFDIPRETADRLRRERGDPPLDH